VGGRRGKGRVTGEYYRSILYMCMKIAVKSTKNYFKKEGNNERVTKIE
jgi:hypothetical protein